MRTALLGGAAISAHGFTRPSQPDNTGLIAGSQDAFSKCLQRERKFEMLKKIVAPVVIGGALLGVSATAGAAYAATPSAPASSSQSANAGQLKTWVRNHRKELREEGLAISAKTIGITPQELVTDLKAGNSIAGIATQHGVEPQTVVNAIVSAADNGINKAVAAGKLPSNVGSEIESALPTRVTKVVDHTF